MSIFISIASFCDPELIPTIDNLIKNSKNPQNLIFGICLQDQQSVIDNFKYKNDSRFRILKILPENSKGCCWARSEIQKLYKDEKYYLQLDSHHRFVKNWDEVCIKCLEMCDSKKPILSTYLNSYEPGKPIIENSPYYMTCEKFYETYKIRFVPKTIEKNYNKPQLWYLMSGHFIFTYGKWVKQVPYDDLIYFDGEEDLLSVRSWTNGWDIYYPHVYIASHFYTRKNYKRHCEVDKEWWKLNEVAINRMKMILDIIPSDVNFGVYGIGKIRSLKQYEDFSGINFKSRSLNNKKCKIWKYDDGYFVSNNGNWIETNKQGVIFNFKSVKDNIMYDKERDISIKIDDNKAYFSKGLNSKEWTFLMNGRWDNGYKKIGVICLYTPNQTNFAIHSVKNHEYYCNKHGYEYHIYTYNLVDESIPTWNKVLAMKNHILDHDYIFWIDSDAVFTNLDIKIEDIIKKQPKKDLLVARDPFWELNSGVIILKKSQWSINMLNKLWKMEHLPHHQGAEQSQLINLLKNESTDRYHIFPSSEFNQHPNGWKKNYFVLHMMGINYEDREKSFRSINKEFGIE
jgi:hypothetical protein